MKKVIICLSFLCAGMIVAPLENTAIAAETNVSAQGTTITAVSFRGNGNFTAKTSRRVTVEETENGLVVIMNGSRYSVRSSNREGYSYMFSDGQYYWYFNY